MAKTMSKMTKNEIVFEDFKDGDVLLLGSGGMNWCWYLEVKVVWPHGKAKVEILRHWRVHRDDYANHPVVVGRYEIIENTSRTACAVRMTMGQIDTFAAVENPKYVFDYKE